MTDKRIRAAALGSSVFLLFSCLGPTGVSAGASIPSEVPTGTRFLVEMRDKIQAKKAKPGKKFDARTLEALRTADGRLIPAGAKLKGRVSYAESDELVLRFEEIEYSGQKMPIIARVVGVPGEKHIQGKVDNEGAIEAKGGRAKSAAIGAAVGAGAGTGAGIKRKDTKEKVLAMGAGAAAGALIGAAIGGGDLVLEKGTRIELELDRPLVL
jgi:hypothetical protein